jgi:aminodeoxyfutalosine deaminase
MDTTLTARWIVPIHGPVLENGTITIADGRIVTVERGYRPGADLGDVVVLPGLVNAHTHLDLTGLAGVFLPSRSEVGSVPPPSLGEGVRGRGSSVVSATSPPRPPSPKEGGGRKTEELPPFDGSFTDWLRAVIRHRRTRNDTQIAADIRAGAAQSLRHGVTLVGDICGSPRPVEPLSEAGPRAVLFREMLGLPLERSLATATATLTWLDAAVAGPLARPGLSPHAPYSVNCRLFVLARDLAGKRKAPLAIHLAETPEELELLTHRTGPFVSFLEELGVWDSHGLARNIQYVIDRCGPALFIHGNYLDPEVELPAGSTIVYCPRTHAYFRHPPHPFRCFLERGVRVALGTDSLASNPDLDVLAEARFLHRLYPDLDPAALLCMVTLSGAEALGWADETGSLEPGKSADLVVIPVETRAGVDPCRLVLESEARPARVLLQGRWVVP